MAQVDLRASPMVILLTYLMGIVTASAVVTVAMVNMNPRRYHGNGSSIGSSKNIKN